MPPFLLKLLMQKQQSTMSNYEKRFIMYNLYMLQFVMLGVIYFPGCDVIYQIYLI